jgi:hypothetical protein
MSIVMELRELLWITERYYGTLRDIMDHGTLWNTKRCYGALSVIMRH